MNYSKIMVVMLMDKFEQFLLDELGKAKEDLEYAKNWVERAEKEYKENVKFFGKEYTSDGEVMAARDAYRIVSCEYNLLGRIYEMYKQIKESG